MITKTGYIKTRNGYRGKVMFWHGYKCVAVLGCKTESATREDAIDEAKKYEAMLKCEVRP